MKKYGPLFWCFKCVFVSTPVIVLTFLILIVCFVAFSDFGLCIYRANA